jgi:hypothetical protein
MSGDQFRDYARLAFLAFVTLEIFVVPPLWNLGLIGPVVLGVTPFLTLAAGVVAVSDRWSYAIVAGGMAAIGLVVRIVSIGHAIREWQLLDAIASMAATATLVAFILKYVFTSATTNWHRIAAALVAYLLYAIIWARAYGILVFFRPNALQLPEKAGDITDLFYFSFATMTTLGYGAPSGAVARSMVAAEAVSGQMYIAILIARLVSAPSPPKRA